jgi:RsiW-degrading membrane proteinase PrsW (M82 family)
MAVAHPHAPTPGRQRRRVLGPIVALVVFGISGLVVLGLVTTSIGPVAVLVGAFCALAPVTVVVLAFQWVDRWEPEPPRTLLFAFLWGACVAALTALLINSSAALVLDAVLGQGSGDVLGASVVAPFVEEGVKGAFVVGLLIFRRREFDGVVDGVVYAGFVAAGFAFTENILYIGRAFAEDSDAMGQGAAVLTTLLLRGVLSPFAHPLFTAMTGIACGLAASRRTVPPRVALVLVGYLLAVLLHALWNGSATLGGGDVFLGVYLFIMVPLFVGMTVLVVWQRRREQRTVREQLPAMAYAGWIAPSEVELLGSLAGRSRWRHAVAQRSGKAAAKAVVDYQTAVTDLAFLRARMARGGVSERSQQWHDERLATLVAARARATGQPDALTAAWRRPPPSGWSPPPPQPPGWQPTPYPPGAGAPYPPAAGQHGWGPTQQGYSASPYEGYGAPRPGPVPPQQGYGPPPQWSPPQPGGWTPAPPGGWTPQQPGGWPPPPGAAIPPQQQGDGAPPPPQGGWAPPAQQQGDRPAPEHQGHPWGPPPR